MSEIPQIDSYNIPQEIVSNIVNWKIDPDRAVLLFHDMQHYFLRPFSIDSNPASSLLSNSKRIRAACISADVPIAFTAQPGDMTEKQRGLLKDFWGPGMTSKVTDREVIDSIAPRPEDWMFTKWRYSAFVNTNLLERLQATGRDQLIICGVYAHVGILTTALEAFSYDVQPFIVSDAIADFTAEDHFMTLEYTARHCAMVVTSDQVLKNLEDYNETY